MQYWLVKSEPNEYGWEDLQKNREDVWDGIRNYQARNFLKAMKLGDQVLFYHSGKTKEIVGVAEVSEEAFPDSKDTENKGWVAVKITAGKTLKKPVNLEQIKTNDILNSMPLIKQSRLSVMPIEKNQFDLIVKLSS
ncbi:EVE domain-containing protein [Cecembia sp.]|uniref:EVE domain-containing protein n=1 Tax=Cecembia sp. TaxID=1898110 RepID=UPI0025BABDC3|nr:EVE domain-containing protein [Cecembia sp.]